MSDFRTSGVVTLDGGGGGILRFAPRGRRWQVYSVTVGVSTSVLEAQARMYRYAISPQNLIDGTSTASSGDTTDTKMVLADGDPFFVVFSGGDPGAIATVTVAGVQNDPGTESFNAVS